MAKPKAKNANKLQSTCGNENQRTVHKAKNHDQKYKDQLKKALNSFKNNLEFSNENKPNPVPSPSTIAKTTKKEDAAAKPKSAKSKVKSFSKITLTKNVPAAAASCSTPPNKNAPLHHRTKKRSNNGFIEEMIHVTKSKSPSLKRKSNGFIETNTDNEEETKCVGRILHEHKRKIVKALGGDPTIPVETFPAQSVEEVPTPLIVVHDAIGSNTLAKDTTSSASDSEDDSYIDRFFNGHSGSKAFNSNDALTVDKIGKLARHNGFMSASSPSSTSDEQRRSDDSNASFDLLDNEETKPKQNVKPADQNNQLIHYKGYSDVDDSDSGEHYLDVDSDDYQFDAYFDETNGEYISDGDEYDVEVCSSSSDDDEEEEGEEEESDFDLEDSDTSADGPCYEYDDESSDREHYSTDECELSTNESDSEYDEFMRGRCSDESNDSDFYDSDYDDLVIAQGTAISYRITDKRINMFENDTSSRLIELPKSDSEDEICAELVPLTVTRREVQNNERHTRQTKKRHDDVIALKAHQRQLDHERQWKLYSKMDESQATFPPPADEVQSEELNPIVITCLPGILENFAIDSCIPDESASEASSDQFNLEVDANLINRSVITSVSFYIPPASSMEIENEAETSSQGDDNHAECNNAMMPVENGHAEFSQSERIKNRNINLSKSQIAKTKPKFFNSINSQHVLLLLRNIIHFHGNLQVKLIAGNAQVFGYQLECNKYVTVHSPRGHSLIYLMPAPPQRKAAHNTTSLAALNELKTDFIAQDIDELIAEFNQSTDAIILLERDTKHKGVNMIDRYMRETMFPNINAFNNESDYYSSEFILHCQFSFRSRNSLVINEAWSTVALKTASKLVTIGGKGVGKSTFVRYTINSNISKFKKFVFIDLDIGQPELFVPQTISATLLTNPILGPGYLENIPPTKAIFFGEINVLLNPIKYLRCVVELFEFCRKHEAFQNVPWVINTMGYNRSLGSELMACILRIFQPTDVVQIQSETANENFDAIINANYVNAFKLNILEEDMVRIDTKCNFRTHTFMAITGSDSSSKQKQIDMTPKDIRYAMILSKLGNCLRCNSDWLTSIRPFEASLNDLTIIVANGDKIDADNIADVLNANLVYLCESKVEYSNDIVDCHGIGIVRAIDTSTEKLYLISSIPGEELAKVNVLAIGAIPLPSAVLLNQHGQVRGTVPFVYNSDGFVGSKQVTQHIFRSEKNRKNHPIELMEN